MKTELQTDLSNLVNTLRLYGEDGTIAEMKWKFINVAFKEFLCSETFNKYDNEQRKLVFDLYEGLTIILEDIEEFRTKYPEGIKEADIMAVA
jgi:hypothetical protein